MTWYWIGAAVVALLGVLVVIVEEDKGQLDEHQTLVLLVGTVIVAAAWPIAVGFLLLRSLVVWITQEGS